MSRQGDGAPWVSSSPTMFDETQATPEPAQPTPTPPAPSGARDRPRLVGGLVFLVTFVVYWWLGPVATPYDFQLSQANNLLHGHLDMTVEYTRNLNLLERVLYDGQGFCLPVNDPRGPEVAALIENPRITAECKHYSVHALGPAIMLLPLVMLFGMTVNQTLVSAVFGAAMAVIVFAITRHFISRPRTQLALTALAVFGTTLWYSSADGSVWHFAMVTAAFFVFASIYATVVLRNPLLAGVLVGAAFMCRPTTIMAGFFPLVAFSDLWLRSGNEGFMRRINVRPLIGLAAGVAPLVVLWMGINYARFGSPFESGYSYIEEFFQEGLSWLWPPFSLDYLGRHVDVMLERTPVFATVGSFIWPSWGGHALWITSPALLMGLFVNLRRYRAAALVAAVALLAACAIILVSGIGQRLELTTWSVGDIPLGLHLLPFWLLIAVAVALSLAHRDRLVFACWAAIIPLVLVNWMFTGTGWAQFSYRFALDFIPFLYLLVVLAVPRLRWYHATLIGISVLVNLWGVLWIFKFAPAQLFGWTWVGW